MASVLSTIQPWTSPNGVPADAVRAGPADPLRALAMLLGARDVSVAVQINGPGSYKKLYAGHDNNSALTTDTLFNCIASRVVCNQDDAAFWADEECRTATHAVFIAMITADRSTKFAIGVLIDGNNRAARNNVESRFYLYRPLLGLMLLLAKSSMDSIARLDGCKAALDRCNAAIFLLDRNADIVHENRSALQLLERGAGLIRCGRSIVATDLQDSLRLRVAIEHVLAGPEGTKQPAPLISIKAGRGRQRLLALIMRPDDVASEAHDCALLLFVFNPENDHSRLFATACHLQGLSPVEANLACQLVRGATISEAANVMRVKEMTARGYLKQIYVKTGVNRQSSLIRLILSNVVNVANDVNLVVL